MPGAITYKINNSVYYGDGDDSSALIKYISELDLLGARLWPEEASFQL